MEDLAGELAAAGLQPAGHIALVSADLGTAVAWRGGSRLLAARAVAVVQQLSVLEPRWVWWNAQDTVPPLSAGGVRPDRCWDLAAVGQLLGGFGRTDPGLLWASAHGLPLPEPPPRHPDLFQSAAITEAPVGADGRLEPAWVAGGWNETPESVLQWAELALRLADRQREAIEALTDPRRATPPSRGTGQSLALLTAHAESAAAQLAVELEHDGLPLDRRTASEILAAAIGSRPDSEAQARLVRAERAREVLRHFPGEPDVDLRSARQVRELLARIGLDLPDTRSWRLEPHAPTSPAVAALLAWRRADRLETTSGWRWLEANVGADGRLRGHWSAADGAAGRMSAGAGLHNMPAELRPAVRAEPGRLLVRADLGQIEPRVLAAVSGDETLIAATHDADMYAPVAARLGCDRPTAKVAVLAAMYGQTSGAAGETLRAMNDAYPLAMRYLADAESAGRARRSLRTYGGRLVRFGAGVNAGDAEDPGDPGGLEDVEEDWSATTARGRYGRNAMIQGAAAELFKAWAVTVRHACGSIDAEIVLCLHDELVLHVGQQDAHAAEDVLTTSLAATASWWTPATGVRLIANVTTGESWADAH